MDFDVKHLLEIMGFIDNLKKTYRAIAPNKKPRYYNRPYLNRNRYRRPRERFWI